LGQFFSIGGVDVVIEIKEKFKHIPELVSKASFLEHTYFIIDLEGNQGDYG